MKKIITKIICFTVAAVASVGACMLSGCSAYYNSSALSGDTSGTVESNGGFAVKKGEYIYFINGSASSSDDNTYGDVVSGAIMRISEDDFANRNYTSVETVVPLVVYAGSTDSGIYIYGDRVYYTTPSTDKNADGEVQNSILEFKSSKLDGTETMKDCYLQLETNSDEYRYVQGDDGVVYILYINSSETLYDESTAVSNLHSYNTETGEDKLLAYDVDTVIFDTEDLTNQRVYYTMSVHNYYTDEDYSYNQVWTVTADCSVEKEYNFDSSLMLGWVTEEDVEDDDSLEQDYYVNNGELVLDGIGDISEGSPFNYGYDETEDKVLKSNTLDYTYTLVKYENDTLFYTRITANNDSEYLFAASDADITGGSWNAIDDNASREDKILTDGSSASDYKFLFDDNGSLYGALIAESDGGLTMNKLGSDGKLQTKIVDQSGSSYYHIISSGTVTMLFIDDNYLYYSLSGDGANGYSVNRIDYTLDYSEYNGMPVPNEEGDVEASSATGVRILDIDASSDWYMPELIDGQLLFCSETDEMSSYNYIMVCDLRESTTATETMSNAKIAELNDLYESVADAITDYCEDLNETYYANLESLLNFAFYACSGAFFTTEDLNDYVYDLAEACNAEALEEAEEDDTDYTDIYSDRTLAVYSAFLNATGDWEEYHGDSKTINGVTVYCNNRDYYYSILGAMSEDDEEDYIDALKSAYLQDYPEEETWWESIGSVGRGWFIAGMCVLGVLIVGGVVTIIVLNVRRKKKGAAPRRRRRITVDTTDDKSIDVYADDDDTPSNNE